MEEKQIGSLPPGILSILLNKLGIYVQNAAVESACTKTKEFNNGPVGQLGHILTEIKNRNAKAALIRWERFDHRCLPALVWREKSLPEKIKTKKNYPLMSLQEALFFGSRLPARNQKLASRLCAVRLFGSCLKK